VQGLSFSGSASNANCALRTLRRMLHKAEEWNLIGRVPEFRLLTEHGRAPTDDLPMFTTAGRSSRCERSGYTDISPNPYVSRSSPKSLAFRDSRSELAFVTLNTEVGKSNKAHASRARS
jgi:hypothetical protein